MAATKKAKALGEIRKAKAAIKAAAKPVKKAEKQKIESMHVLDLSTHERTTVKEARARLRKTPQEKHKTNNETLVSLRLDRERVAKLDEAASTLGVTRSAAARLAVQYMLSTMTTKRQRQEWARDLARLAA